LIGLHFQEGKGARETLTIQKKESLPSFRSGEKSREKGGGKATTVPALRRESSFRGREKRASPRDYSLTTLSGRGDLSEKKKEGGAMPTLFVFRRWVEEAWKKKSKKKG